MSNHGAGGATAPGNAPEAKREEITLHVEGMTCGSCVARVDRALSSVAGVRDAAVNLTTGLAAVHGGAAAEALVAAVERAGYSARVLAGGAAATLREVGAASELHALDVRRRLVLGTLAGVPVLLIDLFMPRLMVIHSMQGLEAFSVASVALSAVVMIAAGWPFFVGAWRAVRHFSANMDVLVALGSGVAFVYSLVLQILIWAGRVPMLRYHLEFHAAVTIVVLVTLGKYLEARAKRRASAGVAGLAAQAAATAMLMGTDGTSQTVPAERIVVGDRVQVLAHQSVPMDGEVVEGSGTADLSVITGESVPVAVMNGTNLPGGAVLTDGRVVVRATATAGESTTARILELVNAAQASKTQIQALADRVAGVFVPMVLVLAAGNFAAWTLFGGGWEQALMTTIATIVIACPCAMGLATPTAITVAMGTAARAGILFTQARALETAGKIGTVVFDKTGTLTEGRPRVATVLPLEGIEAKELLRIAASVEQYSEHPLAKAIMEEAGRLGASLMEPERFSSAAGGGVQAAFAAGKEYAVGSREFAAGFKMGGALIATEEMTARGESVVVIVDVGEKRWLGAIGLADALRADALTMVEKLHEQGVRLVVISGDTQQAVQGTISKLPGIDQVRAQVRPEEKAAAVEAFKKDGRGAVAFVGDGVNDGPALAAADLGIAMASGTDLAKSAGDVLLMGNRLTAVPEVIDLSQRTMRIIKQNLFWAFAYNVAAVPLAMLGMLPPGVAAGAMMLSSLTVVGNALRLHGRGRGMTAK